MQRQQGFRSVFAATKVIEGDHLILNQLKLDENETEMLEHIVSQMERSVDLTVALQLQICGLILLKSCVNRRL